MKTPREILFAHHQADMPKLDAIRCSVMDELNKKETKEQRQPAFLVASLLRCSNKIWLELVWPCRRTWTGLAAVWLVLFLINFSQRDPASSGAGRLVHAPAVMMSWQAQQRWMSELLADRAAPPDADRPRNDLPKPRTEIALPAVA